MGFIEMFKKEKSVVFLSVIEDEKGQGVRTYFNPLIRSFPEAYKDQLISFLDGIIKELKQKDGKKDA